MLRRIVIARCVAGLLVGLSPAGSPAGADAAALDPAAAFERHGAPVPGANSRQFFRFIGNDDIRVVVDGQMVFDLGGVHSAQEQDVDVNRLGMTDGDTYRLDFFLAERHRTQANFRITTNLPLVSLEVPTVSVMHD